MQFIFIIIFINKNVLTYYGQVDFGISGGWLFEIDPTFVNGRILVANAFQIQNSRLWVHAEYRTAIKRFLVGPMGTVDDGFCSVRSLHRGSRYRGTTTSGVVTETCNDFIILRRPNNKFNLRYKPRGSSIIPYYFINLTCALQHNLVVKFTFDKK